MHRRSPCGHRPCTSSLPRSTRRRQLRPLVSSVPPGIEPVATWLQATCHPTSAVYHSPLQVLASEPPDHCPLHGSPATPFVRPLPGIACTTLLRSLDC